MQKRDPAGAHTKRRFARQGAKVLLHDLREPAVFEGG